MRHDRATLRAPLGALALAICCGPGALDAQEPPTASRTPAESAIGRVWNAPRALRLVEGAVEARRHAYADSSLGGFRADVQGHVYFLGRFRQEREIIRADQIALDVWWQAPDRALQTIVGRRHEVRLPTDIRYHIDHLSLVLDNWGDRIRLGDGDEVWNVLHPAAAGAMDFYDYRLADSLMIGVGDRDAWVYEVEVRPRDARSPGVVGSVYVERQSGAIARMRLTFTRASYRDPELVAIVLDLRSSLVEGRYWLPAVQDFEIRRSLSWLDFPVETTIRTRLEVLDYRLNDAADMRLAPGDKVASLPNPVLAAFDGWREPLYGGPLEAGDRSDEELAQAMRGARGLLRQQGLLGGGRLRLALPDASSGLRARRAEGVLVGAGGSYRIDDRTRTRFWGGYPAGIDRPEARFDIEREVGLWSLALEGRLRSMRDVGFAAAAGTVQTLGLALRAEDYTDPFFESGARLSASRPLGEGRVEVGASVTRQDRARLAVGAALFGDPVPRPVRPIDEGELVGLDARASLRLGDALGADWWLEGEGEAGTGVPDGLGFARGIVRVRASRDGAGSDWGWSGEIALGTSAGELPAQRLFLLGGRGTLPGHAFRPWGGDRFALWRGEVSRAIVSPWVRLRVLGAAGRTDLSGVGGPAAVRFGVAESDGWRGSAGVGLGLFYDLLRVDVVRPLGDAADAGWELLLSLNPMLWGIL